MESSHRGLVHHLGKVAWGKLHREFESPTLRKDKEPGAKAAGDCIFAGEGGIQKLNQPNFSRVLLFVVNSLLLSS